MRSLKINLKKKKKRKGGEIDMIQNVVDMFVFISGSDFLEGERCKPVML